MGAALRGRIQTRLLLERDSGKCNAQASNPWDDMAQLLQGLGGVNADSRSRPGPLVATQHPNPYSSRVRSPNSNHRIIIMFLHTK